MQKYQESKIKMSRTVAGILNVFPEIVAKTPGLSEAQNELTHLIGETERHTQGQQNTGTELTEVKHKTRLALETSLRKVCAAMAAFTMVSTDPSVQLLKKKFQINDSEFIRKRDMQLFALAYSVYGDTMPYADKLIPFITPDEVNELKDLADNFNELLPQKQTQRSKSILSTQNLEDAVSQIDLLLNDTIDVLVKPWEFKDSDFYKTYKNGRMIVDTSSRKAKTPEVVPAKTA